MKGYSLTELLIVLIPALLFAVCIWAVLQVFDEIQEHGLKSIVTEIWEGKE